MVVKLLGLLVRSSSREGPTPGPNTAMHTKNILSPEMFLRHLLVYVYAIKFVKVDCFHLVRSSGRGGPTPGNHIARLDKN